MKTEIKATLTVDEVKQALLEYLTNVTGFIKEGATVKEIELNGSYLQLNFESMIVTIENK